MYEKIASRATLLISDAGVCFLAFLIVDGMMMLTSIILTKSRTKKPGNHVHAAASSINLTLVELRSAVLSAALDFTFVIE